MAEQTLANRSFPELVHDPVPRNLLGLLLRTKARSFWNRCVQAAAGAPIKISATAILISLIWLGLYKMFSLVFQQLQRTPLEATVAIPLIFNVFFAAMLVLLTISNAIIAYSALFARQESAYLLSAPLTPLDLVSLKYLESLVLASWALVVLGFPLMLALADLAQNNIFYVLFISFFLAFIPIPTALGLLLAWMTARFLTKNLSRGLAVIAGLATVVGVLWGLRSLVHIGETATEAWLRSFLGRMSFVESAFLPNNWIASGIDHALQDKFSESFLYLGVTVANAMFLSWISVNFVARHFGNAYDRASSGWDRGRRLAAPASGGLPGLVFCYLPRTLRLMAAKDLRTFFRDPLQWSQLAILFGLLGLYLTNTPTLTLRFSGLGWDQIIPFLNLCAISLILATFTCRFVFPLVSLEGQKLWLLTLLPFPRRRILLAKFAFAMTVTLLVAVGSMTLAGIMLNLETVWIVIHLSVTASVCFGLCGFAVGIGARLPMFDETNAARIANGFGGTTNLLASVGLVAVVLTGVGVATWRCRGMPTQSMPDVTSLALCAGSVFMGVVAGTIALSNGGSHLDRLEV